MANEPSHKLGFKGTDKDKKIKWSHDDKGVQF